MAIYYSPYPNVAQPITTAPYSTATSDVYVTALSATKKLQKSIGLSWAAYTPSAADNGLTTPYIPGLNTNAAPTVPTVSATAGSPAITVTQNQNFTATPITVFGGSAVATSYTSAGTFVGYTTSIDKALPAGVTWTSTFATIKTQSPLDNKYYTYNAATVTVTGTPAAVLAATNFTISFTDANGSTANATFSLTVNSNQLPLVVSSSISGSKILTQGVSSGIGGFATVSASGGSSPLKYSVSPALPSGLTFNTSTGYVSGTPTVALNATTFTVTVTDNSTSPQTASATFSMAVLANVPTATLAVPTTILTQGISFTAFAPVTGTGGTAPLRYDVSPSLPSGLAFNTGTGILSGTPSVSSAATNYTVAVTDSLQQSASQTFNLTVRALQILTSVQTQPGYTLYRSVAVPSFTPIVANGGYGTISYSLTPTLPAGLSFSNSSGSISGTPTTTSSTATYVVSLSDQAGQTSSGTFALGVISIPISVTQQVPSTLLTKNATFNSFTPVTASGGYTPYAYGISPSLPSGLSYSTSNGLITGTPTSTSPATSYLVTVTDSAAQSGTSSFSLTVLQPAALVLTKVISTLTLVQGTASTPFTPISAAGGYGSLTYNISPTLTTGLSIDRTNGQISGTPSAYSINTTTYTVTVSDQAAQSSSSTFNMNVLTPVFSVASAVPLSNLVTGVAVTAFIPVTAAGGATPYGYALNTSLSAGLSFSTSTGRVSGTPTVANTSSYVVTITDGVGQSGTGSFALSISPVAPLSLTTVVTNTTLVKSVDLASFTPVSASGGYGSISLTVYPPLPSGLNYSNIGRVTGTPTQSSTQTAYFVQGIDSIGQTSSSTFYLTVNNSALTSTVAVSISTLSQYVSFTPFTPVTYVGGTPPVVYSVSPSLSSGISLNSSTGVLSGTPQTTISTTSYNITITDSVGGKTTSTIRLNVIAVPDLVSTRAVGTVIAYANQALIAVIPVTASGGYGSYSYSVTPSLPSGLLFSSVNGQLSGTPSQLSSTATYTVTVTDPISQSTSTSFDLTVKAQPVFATSSVPSTTLIIYQLASPFTPVTGFGGFGTLAYTLNLALPTGLSLNAGTGQITGTPTAISATATYVITVTDSIAQSSTGSFALSVSDVAPDPLIVTVSSPTISLTQNQSANVSPVQVLGGVTPYVYSLTPSLPAGLSFSSSAGTITGSPSVVTSATTYNITVVDGQPQSVTKSFSLLVSGGNVTGSGNVNQINNTANASSTTTGALIVAGGAGIGGNLYAGAVYDNNNRVVTNVNPSGSAYIGISGLVSTGTNVSFTITNLGVLTLTAGTDTVVSSSTGTVTIWNTSNLQTVTDRGHTTTNAINITNATGSKSTTTGALTVSGGVGVGGGAYIGGVVTATSFVGNVYATNTASIQVGFATTSGFALSFNTATLVASAVNATTASFATTSGFALSFNTATLVTTAVNLAGGSTGSIPYQTTAGNTAFIGLGNSNSILYSDGTTATWKLVSELASASSTTSTNASNVYINPVAPVHQYYIGLTEYIDDYSPLDSDSQLIYDTTDSSLSVTKLIVTGTNASTSSVSSNALYVAGGVGIAGSLLVTGPTVFQNNVIFSGTSTYVFSTNTVYTDNIIELHYPVTPGNIWSVDDKKDIGFRFHYYDTQDRNAFLGRNDATGYLEWISSGVEDSTSTVSGTWGTFKTGSIILSNTTASNSTLTGALTVAGGVGVGGGLYVGGVVTATSFVGNVYATNTASIQVGFATTSGFALSFNTATLVSNAVSATTSNFATTSGFALSFNTATLVASAVSATTSTYADIAGVANSLGTGTYSISNTTASTSTTSGALTVAGGLGLGQGAYIGGRVIINNTENASLNAGAGSLQVAGGVYIEKDLTVKGSFNATGSFNVNGYSVSTSTFNGGIVANYTNFTPATPTNSTITGAVTIVGGVGIGGGLYVGGVVTATSFVGNVYATNTASIQVGFANTANNLAGGLPGQIPYQTAIGTTAFITTATAGQFLVSNGSGTPSWSSTASLQIGYANVANTASFATTASNIVVSTASNNANYYITFVSTSSGQLGVLSDAGSKLTYNPGTGVLTISSTASTTSTTTGALIITGGVGIGGSLFVGGVVTATSFVGNIYATNTASIQVGFATTASNVVVSTASNNASYYITFVSTTSGQLGILSDAGSKLTYNPGTNVLTISSTASTTSTTTGALIITGGVGIGGGLYVGGVVTATSIVITGAAGSGSITGVGFISASTATITSTATSTSTTTGALIVTGGVGIGGAIYAGNATITSTATSTSTTTGALIVTGGVGVGGAIYAGNIYSNGALVATGSATFNGGNVSGVTTITNTASTISTTTGALQVAGGVGIGGGLFVGGVVTATSFITSGAAGSGSITGVGFISASTATITSTATSTSTTTGALIVTGGVGVGGALYVANTSYISGAQIITTATIGLYAAASAAITGTTSTFVISNTASTTSTNTGALQVVGGVGIAGGLYVGGVVTATSIVITGAAGSGSITGVGFISASTATITSTATSTSTTTGALIVTGGVGIGGGVVVGGVVTATVYSSNGTISGTSSVGAFNYGTLSFSDSNNFATFQTNVNNYAQVVLQNTNAGTTASSDVIVSNNLGTANTYYGNFGMNSSGFTGVGSFNLPNAVYLASSQGDLVLGTFSPNSIRFALNGGATDAITISTVSNSIIINNTATITATTASVSTNTGALTVAGGVGIGGALYAANTSYVAGAQIITTATISNFAVGTATTSSFANTATNIVVSTASNNASYYITFVSTTSGQLGVLSDAGSKLTYNPGTSVLAIASTATSTSTTTGALIVTGGVGVGGNIYAGNIYSNGALVATGVAAFNGGNVSNIVYINTQAGTTSTTTGALVVQGGVGVGGGVYVGGTVTATTISTVGGNGSITGVYQLTSQNISASGNVNISGSVVSVLTSTNTASAVSTTTGALVVAGGVGVGGAVYASSFVTQGGTGVISGAYQISSQYFISTATIAATSTTTGALQLTGGAGIGGSLYVGGNIDVAGNLTFSGSSSATFSTLVITGTTPSNSTNTGALRVAGGAGIQGNTYVGGNLFVNNGSQVIPTTIQEFTATGGQTTFTPSSPYTVGTVQIFANGVALGNGDFTASNGTTFVLNDARRAGDVIRFIAGVSSTGINNIKAFSIAMSIAMTG